MKISQLFLPVLFLLCFLSYAQTESRVKVVNSLPACRIGYDPVNPDRQPDWNSECLVKSTIEKRIKMNTRSGRVIECNLGKLVPVVIDKTTGIAKWILGCGNDILEPNNWIPEGSKICVSQPEIQPNQTQIQVPPEIKISPSNMRVEGEISHRVNIDGEIRHVHTGEIIHREVPVQQSQKPSKSWWQRNRKWMIPLAIAGAAAGGYLGANRGKNNTIYYQPLPPPPVR